MKIEILQLVEGAKKARGLTVIIDVFRAFSVESIIMGLEPTKLIPVGDIQTALDYRDAHPGAILCGERGGAIIDGFDYGNSPSAVVKAKLGGKTVVHTTSAGTQGIVNATGADEILGGCLLSAKAIACYIKKKNPEQVSLVCMGLAGERPTDEDTLCAEYIKSLLEDRPLEDMPARIEALKTTDGAKFFDPEQQNVFPKKDFHLSTMVDICPFVLRLTQDEESGLPCMERVEVPEAFSMQSGTTLGSLSREQVIFLPDWLKSQFVYGDYTEPDGDFDAALVLGGINFIMESRAKAAAELYHAGRCKLFITTGGVLWDSIYGRLTEAQILKRYMVDFGIPEACIVTEDKATTTQENYLYSRQFLQERFTGRKRIVTVTSYGHLIRSVRLAQAYMPEHEHFGYRANLPVDCPERFTESTEMRRRALKECLVTWGYVTKKKLFPDFPIL